MEVGGNGGRRALDAIIAATTIRQHRYLPACVVKIDILTCTTRQPHLHACTVESNDTCTCTCTRMPLRVSARKSNQSRYFSYPTL